MAVTENTYTGNGSTVLYSFTFPYLATTDIKVSINGVLTTAYTLANATTIQFNTAPVNGAAIRIYRSTSDAAKRATFFPGSSIRAADLNEDFDQVIYIAQETANFAASTDASAIQATANTALANSNAAVSTANTANTTANGIAGTANTALSNSTTAVATANAAQSTATTAQSTANAAQATANAALPLAGGSMSGNITFNLGQTFPNSGLQQATTSQQGIVQLTDSISSTSTTTAATPNSIKTVADTMLPLTGGTLTGNLNVPSLNGGPLAGTRNRIINGDMRIDQRNAGASVTASTAGGFVYTLDRWAYAVSQTSKFTLQQNAGSVTPPAGFTNYLGVTSSSAYSVASGDYFLLRQPVEGFNVGDLAWGTANAKTVTLSFWVRSSLTGTHGGSLLNSAANRSYPYSYTISAANTWEYKTITIAGDTSGTWLTNNGNGITLFFNLGTGATYSGTANTWAGTEYDAPTGAVSIVGTNGATFYITGVQLEAGTVATPFERRSYGQELALCQRYCWVFGNSDNAPFGSGYETATIGKTSAALPVTMRATPTFSSTAANTFSIIDSGSSGRSGTAIALDLASPTAVAVNLTCSGTTANAACILRTASATATMTFNAEL